MHKIKLPQATETMETGTVSRWLKAAGQAVSKGELLVEIETEEQRIELTASRSGRLSEILAPEGTTVAVGADLAILDDADGASDQASPRPPAEPVATGPAGDVTPLVMPQAGNTMEEGTIVSWRVAEGDTISVGDVIYEAETDKATIEVEADHAGRLARIVAHEGDVVAVKMPVAYLADNDADVDAYLAAHPPAEQATPQAPAEAPSAHAPAGGPAAAPAAAPVTEGGRIKASPAARKAAAERGLDLAAIGAGSGPGGRILLADVEKAPDTASQAGRATPKGAIRRPISAMRRAIGRNMLASKQNIPHFYMRLTIDGEAMYEFYRAEKAKYPCTLNDVVVLACAKVLMEMPAFRSQLDGGDFIEFPAANIGVAVGVEDGLVVPVLVEANELNLEELAVRTKRMVEAARGGKVEAMGQGVFTITNVGMLGVEEFSPIINPPEAAILAVGALRDEVVVRDGEVRPGRVMTMTLSADHRIIDGLIAAKFIARLKELLENPSELTDTEKP